MGKKNKIEDEIYLCGEFIRVYDSYLRISLITCLSYTNTAFKIEYDKTKTRQYKDEWISGSPFKNTEYIMELLEEEKELL